MKNITGQKPTKVALISALTILFWLIVFSTFNRAEAHQFSTAYLAIKTHDHTPIATAEYRLAVRDLALLVPIAVDERNQITWGAIKAQNSAISALLAQNLKWKSGTAVCMMSSQREPLAMDQVAGLPYIVTYLSIDCGKSKATTLNYQMLSHIDSGHRLIISSEEGFAQISMTRTEKGSAVSICYLLSFTSKAGSN